LRKTEIMPKALHKPDIVAPVGQPASPETALDLPNDAVGSPAIELQRLLIARYSAKGELSVVALPSPSIVGQRLETLVSVASRLAGPILFVAALAGIAVMTL
jgi:hypothetical protein